jgi:hypothetical protein
MKQDNKVLSHTIANFLLNYRNTPHSVTKETPARLFMGRDLRSCLTETICLGIPVLQNIIRNASIVFVDVVVFNWTTSGHFEWAHTRTKNILSMNGPAKSTWTLSQGADGHSHGCSGVTCGIF